jgi:hypothetical protein
MGSRRNGRQRHRSQQTPQPEAHEKHPSSAKRFGAWLLTKAQWVVLVLLVGIIAWGLHRGGHIDKATLKQLEEVDPWVKRSIEFAKAVESFTGKPSNRLEGTQVASATFTFPSEVMVQARECAYVHDSLFTLKERTAKLRGVPSQQISIDIRSHRMAMRSHPVPADYVPSFAALTALDCGFAILPDFIVGIDVVAKDGRASVAKVSAKLTEVRTPYTIDEKQPRSWYFEATTSADKFDRYLAGTADGLVGERTFAPFTVARGRTRKYFRLRNQFNIHDERPPSLLPGGGFLLEIALVDADEVQLARSGHLIPIEQSALLNKVAPGWKEHPPLAYLSEAVGVASPEGGVH